MFTVSDTVDLDSIAEDFVDFVCEGESPCHPLSVKVSLLVIADNFVDFVRVNLFVVADNFMDLVDFGVMVSLLVMQTIVCTFGCCGCRN